MSWNNHKLCRGIHVHSPYVTQIQLPKLKTWGLTHITYNMYPDPWDPVAVGNVEGTTTFTDSDRLAAYESWLWDMVTKPGSKFDVFLGWCAAINWPVKITLTITPAGSFYTAPGGRYWWHKIFDVKYPWALKAFRRTWKAVADKYKNETRIWGYCPIDEPAARYSGYKQSIGLRILTQEVAYSIYKRDKTNKKIILGARFGNQIYLKELFPSSVADKALIASMPIVYRISHFAPLRWSMMGNVNPAAVDCGSPPAAIPYFQGPYLPDVKYPTVTIPKPEFPQGRILRSKAALRKFFDPVRACKTQMNKPILIGSWGCGRWAPGALQFLTDCISIFEKEEWHWSYFEFIEGNAGIPNFNTPYLLEYDETYYKAPPYDYTWDPSLCSASSPIYGPPYPARLSLMQTWWPRST